MKPDVPAILTEIEAATFTTSTGTDRLRAFVDKMRIGDVVPLVAIAAAIELCDVHVRKLADADPRLQRGSYNRAKTGKKATAYRRVK